MADGTPGRDVRPFSLPSELFVTETIIRRTGYVYLDVTLRVTTVCVRLSGLIPNDIQYKSRNDVCVCESGSKIGHEADARRDVDAVGEPEKQAHRQQDAQKYTVIRR